MASALKLRNSHQHVAQSSGFLVVLRNLHQRVAQASGFLVVLRNLHQHVAQASGFLVVFGESNLNRVGRSRPHRVGSYC